MYGWDATFQAAKLRLNPRFAKAPPRGNFAPSPTVLPALKISQSVLQKGLFPALSAATFRKIFKRKFGLEKSSSTFAHPNGKLATATDWILSDGVTGNTLDFDSRKSRFEPWSDNRL
jgi:hypothetical protein